MPLVQEGVPSEARPRSSRAQPQQLRPLSVLRLQDARQKQLGRYDLTFRFVGIFDQKTTLLFFAGHLYHKHKIKQGRFLNMLHCELCGHEAAGPRDLKVVTAKIRKTVCG